MTIAVPTLSTLGWVRSAEQKADFLMSHFYESDKFQTYLYGTNVTNVQWLIEQYGHDPLAVCDQLKRALEQYLGRYFDAAVVEVTSDDNPTYTNPPNEASAITLRLYVQVVEAGKEYVFSKLIRTKNSKFEVILNLNNEGTVQ